MLRQSVAEEREEQDGTRPLLERDKRAIVC